jgi:hypothetical protein
VTRYVRAPSPGFRRHFVAGGLLAPLLGSRFKDGLRLDVHLREQDKVQVYYGLTSLLTASRTRRGVKLTASSTYRKQACASGLFRTWGPEERGFEDCVAKYLAEVAVERHHFSSEGRVQAEWARVTSPWTPFDREAVIGYTSRDSRRTQRAFKGVEEARREIEALRALERPWAALKRGKVNAELDQLAIDPEGRLVLIELKDGTSTAPLYYAPLQLLQYVHEWSAAFASLKPGLKELVEARKELGLSPADTPALSGGLRPVLAFGDDRRSKVVRARFAAVREIVNRHLPPGVSPIEVWMLDGGAPRRLD